jgi:hypothetical protein
MPVTDQIAEHTVGYDMLDRRAFRRRLIVENLLPLFD